VFLPAQDANGGNTPGGFSFVVKAALDGSGTGLARARPPASP